MEAMKIKTSRLCFRVVFLWVLITVAAFVVVTLARAEGPAKATPLTADEKIELLKLQSILSQRELEAQKLLGQWQGSTPEGQRHLALSMAAGSTQQALSRRFVELRQAHHAAAQVLNENMEWIETPPAVGAAPKPDKPDKEATQ